MPKRAFNFSSWIICFKWLIYDVWFTFSSNYKLKVKVTNVTPLTNEKKGWGWPKCLLECGPSQCGWGAHKNYFYLVLFVDTSTQNIKRKINQSNRTYVEQQCWYDGRIQPSINRKELHEWGPWNCNNKPHIYNFLCKLFYHYEKYTLTTVSESSLSTDGKFNWTTPSLTDLDNL